MTAISPLLLVEPPAHRAPVATFPVSPGPGERRRPAGPGTGPRLRAIDGGRSAVVRHRRRVYRQRRAVAALLAVVTLVVAGRVVLAGAGLVSSPAVEPGPVQAVAPAGPVADAPVASAGSVYVVRPGDTLWSIARQVRPDRDPRAVVDELSARVPGGLEPGQRVDLTDLDG
jgi:hypothetical protein